MRFEPTQNYSRLVPGKVNSAFTLENFLTLPIICKGGSRNIWCYGEYALRKIYHEHLINGQHHCRSSHHLKNQTFFVNVVGRRV